MAVRVDRDALRVTYEVHNPDAFELGLFNGLPPAPPETARRDPSAVHLNLVGDVLEVRQFLEHPWPPLTSDAVFPPLATRLAPGATARETLVLPHPIRANHPYAAALSTWVGTRLTGDQPRDATSVRLFVGVFPIDATMQLVPYGRDAFAVFTPGLADAAQLVLHQTVGLPRRTAVLDF